MSLLEREFDRRSPPLDRELAAFQREVQAFERRVAPDGVIVHARRQGHRMRLVLVSARVKARPTHQVERWSGP